VNTRSLKPKHGPTMLVRPLRNGDVDTVLAVFYRLSEQSRRRRFNGAKARLTEEELWALARVDATHHAFVAYVEGDADPVAIARLVRDGQAAEIAVEVANDYQQRGIGTALTEELLADARAAGITEVTALFTADNPAAISLLRRALRVLDISLQGPELWIRAAIPHPSQSRAPSLQRLPWDNSLDWTNET
jgi:ribosomal protein S18 acetylase RimI-like enzyme